MWDDPRCRETFMNFGVRQTSVLISGCHVLAESSWESDSTSLEPHLKMGINLDAVGLCVHPMRMYVGPLGPCPAYSRHSAISPYIICLPLTFSYLVYYHTLTWTQLSSQISSTHRTQNIWSWKGPQVSSSLEMVQEFLSTSQLHQLVVTTTWDSEFRFIPACWGFLAIID